MPQRVGLACTLVLAWTLAACGGAAPADSGGLPSQAPATTSGATVEPSRAAGVAVIGPDDPGRATLTGGTYTISWDHDCTSLATRWVPLDGDPVTIATDGPSGSLAIDLPAGPGEFERVVDCPSGATYRLRVQKTG